MPSLDIFNNDAFSLQSLSQAMVDLPYTPTRIGDLKLFKESGMSTTSLSIERVGRTLKLVQSAQRGSQGKPIENNKRKLISINAVHLPERGAVYADEVQNVRAFGSESELQTVQGVVNEQLEQMKMNLDVTMEWHRIGAIKGEVLDADGTSVLLNMFDTFNLVQQTHDLVLDSDSTKVKIKVVEAKRKLETALGGIMYRGLRAFCSNEFFDALVGHPAVAKAYDLWLDGQFLREDQRGGFPFCGVQWEEYRGGVGATSFIEDNACYLVPEGVPGMFITKFAPADYMETVNTIGLPYYVKQEMMKMGKGVEFEGQSNPISINTRPDAVIKLTI
jgi:hypothetical protein